ncbi:hypothetical protein Poli38472_012218 [Pythium oligandrum]|uniref:Activator of Hsp90 ATPase AHSA1-like N-terminal domain-containing protein n=1 Tax=Pythium oligandrum TaxID=41045 RepID=A0A8K1CP17_PYTOL|nr:hypothetical protein Poli38472_012218 [Pythium oligandrum]|eukprot:TMW67102.1 hypothetical protein Poli38472_012218 [Pythium oligandrum]
MFGGDGLPFTRHSDVLNATPTDDDGLVRLVEELKRRGNAAFTQKAYEEAEALYTKAIDINASNPLQNQHIFFANRSASRTSMGKTALALDDAEACIELVKDYAKGYFRKAQALKGLKRFKDALEVLQTARTLEPENKSLNTLQKQLEELATKQAEAPAPKPAVEKKVTRVEVVKEDAPKPAAASSSSTKVVVDDEEIVGHVRGYKKLADGRVTTFFNNELTEEAKKLIGDIAPKKVEDPNKVQIKSVEGGSAWNQGNTFEEKDLTTWAKTKLESLLVNFSVPLNASGGVIKTKEIKDLSGDASIAVFRGKKRYIFDFTFSLAVTAELADGTTVDGDLKFLDMSSDADGDYDVEAIVPSRYQSEAGKALHAALASSSSPFRSQVGVLLASFVKEYHTF